MIVRMRESRLLPGFLEPCRTTSSDTVRQGFFVPGSSVRAVSPAIQSGLCRQSRMRGQSAFRMRVAHLELSPGRATPCSMVLTSRLLVGHPGASAGPGAESLAQGKQPVR